ncbi:MULTISPECIES: tripartite tricarboxylate transporter TctB family protein [Rhodomicrobium]|uniref:tripartite tricarboxylate transporter TctB family protein n=1 Tax=Rhodomicrobium TaxID=1068 RepID=UPI000B4B0BE8|nr:MULTISPECIES: tripartite tricarboxylate transporter TctB family protein [Rhodomicrobium]
MSGDPKPSGRRDAAGFFIAAGLLAFAVLISWDASNHGAGPAYSRIGPAAAAYAVAAGLAVIGAASLLAAWRGEAPERETFDLLPVILILVGLAGQIAAIAFGGGFILGATVLFAATARAFGRKALIADAAIGFTLSFLVYLMFTKLLSLSLPQGPFERLF